MKIGLQLYSVRDAAEKDFDATLKAVKEMGYEGVELAGLYGHSAEEVKELLAKHALTLLSAHVPYQELMDDSEKVFETYQTLGCPYIALPHLSEEHRMDGSKAEEAYQNIALLGKLAKAYGIKMLYHNHDFEFVKLENGNYGLDELYERIPADLLETELDTCWIKVAGEDPVAYLEKYSGRAPIVHIKDFYMPGSSEGAYELIGDDSEVETSNTFEFRALGEGMQDVCAVVDAAEKAGATWIVVELDRAREGRDAMDEVAKSIVYLQSNCL